MSFDVIPGDPGSSHVLHVPHSSTRIPPDVREQILLSDDELAVELRHMTDARTDELATAAAERASLRPWLFVNRLSRLAVDPERFPDEREEMRRVGMGAVYTQTSQRQPLRQVDRRDEQDLLERFFHPYAAALADLIDDRLAQTGSVALLDLHSYPERALPYELHQQARRPAVCLGLDELHTPPRLLQQAQRAFERCGDVVVNEPFIGTYVPLRHYGCDLRVSSLMIELRRDSYLDENGDLEAMRSDRVVTALVDLVNGSSS